MFKKINLTIVTLCFSIVSFANSGDSCEITLEGFKRSDGFIIFRNSQPLEGNLNPFSLTGIAKKKFYIPCPVMFYKADVSCAPFFLMPDDKLTIIKTNNDYTFRFKSEIRTNEQNLLWKIYKLYGPIYGSQSLEKRISEPVQKKSNSKNTELSSIDYLTHKILAYKKLYDNEINEIKVYKQSHTISANFENYLEKYFYYRYLSSIIKEYTFSTLSPALNLEIIQALNLGKENPSLLNIDSYRSFLGLYNYLIQKAALSYTGIRRVEIIAAHFENSARDYLLFEEIKNQLNQLDTSFTLAVDYFNKVCKNEEYIKR